MEWVSFSGLVIAINLVGAFILTLYKLGELHLLYYYLTRRRRLQGRPAPAPIAEGELPRVTVQIPMYNELYVAERIIDACVALDYPRHLLDIQVLDDSTDQSLEVSQARVAHWRQQGVDIVLRHRADRSGYKAGALRDATPHAKGQFIAVFDADFVPPRDFLRRGLPHFRDTRVGVFQARWGHLNPTYSMLTRVQTVFLDMHFVIEHQARQAAGLWSRFNGSAGIWRARCLADAGGWSADTLAEDLDLVFRAQLKGWTVAYDPTLVAPAEVPVRVSDLKAQQYRWTKGKAQVVRKLGGTLLRARLPMLVKGHALFDLLNLTAFPGILLLSLGTVPLLWVMLARPEYTPYLAWASGFFVLNSLVWPWYVLVVVRQRHASWLGTFAEFLIVFPPLVPIAMSATVFQVTAILDGFFGKPTAFEKTGKFRIVQRSDRWRDKLRVSRRAGATTYLEGMLMLVFLSAIGLGVYLQNLAILPFHVILACGYAYIFSHSLVRA